MFNGPIPTLIVADLVPRPSWAEGQITSYSDGQSVLGESLATCPAVFDERIRAAIDLAIAGSL